MGIPDVPRMIDDDLYDRLVSVIKPGDICVTVGPAAKANEIYSVERDVIRVITERSRSRTRPEPVDGWMFNVAWRRLKARGTLTYAELVDTAKRSSAVCAILARLPEVEVISSRPIKLGLVTKLE